MFDKIFKIIVLLISGFIAYTFYLYVLNTRYVKFANRAILDRRTGFVHAPKIIKAQTDKKPESVFKTKEEALEFLNIKPK